MTNKEKLRKSIYYLYNMYFLPLDGDDFEVMFRALAQKLHLDLSGDEEWEEFCKEINGGQTQEEEWFTNVFNKYF